MARYYKVILTPPDGGPPPPFSAKGNPSGFILDSTGNPAALQVEFDLASNSNGSSGSGSKILRIYGIPYQDVAQAVNWDGYGVQVFGGWTKGFPLSTMMATNHGTGLLISGTAQFPVANWKGTELYVDIPIIGMAGAAADQDNIVMNYQVGQTMQSAIQNTFATAYPTVKSNFFISPNLVCTQAQLGTFTSMEEFIKWANKESMRQLGGSVNNYQGVQIGWRGNQIFVMDQTVKVDPQPIPVAYSELIGNIARIQNNTFQVMCLMRSDIQVGSIISLPTTSTQNQAAAPIISASGLPSRAPDPGTQWSGNYGVLEIRHLGDFRGTGSGMEWVTIITCADNSISI